MSTYYTTIIEEGVISKKFTTGEVYCKKRSSSLQPRNTTIKDLVFEPGSRSNWHINNGLKVLVATDGIGYFQERGTSIRLLHKGDVVTVLPGVEHWYGATVYSTFSHIAIITESNTGAVIWLDGVTDAEYNSYSK